MTHRDESIAQLLDDAAKRSKRYWQALPERSVQPDAAALAGLSRFDQPFPARGIEVENVLKELDEFGSPATIASAGPRYFGFVTGGSVPASLAANWLGSCWDQNAAFSVQSPVAAKLESVALGWILEALQLPASWGGGFVTGTTMGNVSGLVIARNTLLEREGWDVAKQGLFGAPSVRVVVSEEAHSTLFYALSFAGLGAERVQRVPVDGQGRMRADALPNIDGPTIVCLQAGNVNTGAFDPILDVATKAHERNAWVHLDGAFGLWAGVASARRHLIEGLEEVDSVATDLHKWLNVPYDNGLALYKDPGHAQKVLSLRASYLPDEVERQPCDYVPEASRRARGIDVWAALRALGRDGLAELVERNCRYASRFAEGLQESGHEILNRVELNQVLVSFGSDDKTNRVIEVLQKEGTCWCGGTFWQGRAAMRISVSSWATTEADVEQSLEAILRVAAETE